MSKPDNPRSHTATANYIHSGSDEDHRSDEDISKILIAKLRKIYKHSYRYNGGINEERESESDKKLSNMFNFLLSKYSEYDIQKLNTQLQTWEKKESTNTSELDVLNRIVGKARELLRFVIQGDNKNEWLTSLYKPQLEILNEFMDFLSSNEYHYVQDTAPHDLSRLEVALQDFLYTLMFKSSNPNNKLIIVMFYNMSKQSTLHGHMLLRLPPNDRNESGTLRYIHEDTTVEGKFIRDHPGASETLKSIHSILQHKRDEALNQQKLKRPSLFSCFRGSTVCPLGDTIDTGVSITEYRGGFITYLGKTYRVTAAKRQRKNKRSLKIPK